MIFHLISVVVTNSLIIPPSQSHSDYDPYHLDNLQHHWHFQSPQRFMVGPSYSQGFIQPEYSTIHNNCVRSNDWVSTYPTTRVAQEVNQQNKKKIVKSNKHKFNSIKKLHDTKLI